MKLVITLLVMLDVIQVVIISVDNKRITALEQYVCKGIVMDTCIKLLKDGKL